MKKEKGFTLIELLAVIIILAIIALIAIPTITNIVEKASKSAFQDSIYGILEAGELYYTNELLSTEGMHENKTFNFEGSIEGLEIKGSKPSSGTMVVTTEGKIGIAVSNGKYCVKKGINDEDTTIDEDLENCTIPSGGVQEPGGDDEPTVPNPYMTSTDSCIHDTATFCPTKTDTPVTVTVQLNADTTGTFYVIGDTGEELTLIMDRNIGDKVAWISQADYETAGGTGWNAYLKTDKGPLTALTYLETQTSGWTNIPTMTYILNDDNTNQMYQPITRTNVRARMLTKTEASTLNCSSSSGSCKSYIYENTSSSNTTEAPSGYWLSTAASSSDARCVNYAGRIYSGTAYESNAYGGVRPVITLSKTL